MSNSNTNPSFTPPPLPETSALTQPRAAWLPPAASITKGDTTVNIKRGEEAECVSLAGGQGQG